MILSFRCGDYRPINSSDDFKNCSSSSLCVDRLVFVYTRAEGDKIALSYEKCIEKFVIWTINKDFVSHLEFEDRAPAIIQAIRMASTYHTGQE